MPPTANAARNATASMYMGAASRSLVQFGAGGLGGVERGGEPLILAVVPRAVPEARSADAGRAVTPDDVALGVFDDHLVDEQVLRDDDVAFHAHHLGDVRDAAGAVAQAGGLHDNIDRRRDHLANGARRQREAAHRD